jgi:hypothetical protein
MGFSSLGQEYWSHVWIWAFYLLTIGDRGGPENHEFTDMEARVERIKSTGWSNLYTKERKQNPPPYIVAAFSVSLPYTKIYQKAPAKSNHVSTVPTW